MKHKTYTALHPNKAPNTPCNDLPPLKPPRPIIILPLSHIAQNIIRLINLRHLVGRLRLSLVHRRAVRVVLHAHLAVRLLDLVLRCGLGDAEDLVETRLGRLVIAVVGRRGTAGTGARRG